MKVLVIGSSVCDVIIRVHSIPQSGEDENIISQCLQIGGCAFNVASQLKYFDIPFDLFSPIGTGVYGTFVRQFFERENIPILLETSKPNGCCYCLVEDDGERTFICEHGGEYLFQKEWFSMLNPHDYEYVYVCGLELEETTGDVILDFLEAHSHFQIVFAPSSRIHTIEHHKMQRILSLHPIIHISESEILQYTHSLDLQTAAMTLYQKTHHMIIVTLGEKGCYVYDGKHHYAKGEKVQVVDTIGAGDSHAGAMIASLSQGKTIEEAMIIANHIASLVVQQKGAKMK